MTPHTKRVTIDGNCLPAFRIGLMEQRYACINDLPISEADRKFHWDRNGPRPADHPSLSELGF